MQTDRKTEIKTTVSALLIPRKYIHFGDGTGTMSRVIDKFKKAELPTLIQKEISIKQPVKNNLEFTLQGDSYTFRINDTTRKRIATELLHIAIDPLKIAELLKDIDQELGNQLYGDSDGDSKLAGLKTLKPKYYIAGRSFWIPGPPENNFFLAKKNKQLDKLLLEREKKVGVNTDGALRFIDFVQRGTAIAFMAGGRLFTEDGHHDMLLLHGKYTHRLFFEALRQAIIKKELDLSNEENKPLTLSQVIEFLVKTQVTEPDSRYLSRPLWDYLIDLSIDTLGNALSNQHLLLPENYRYSCRAAFMMNSILLCFGKQLGLPNLQSYLLSAHYKMATMMVSRVTDALPPGDSSLDFDKIYTCCMMALTAKSQSVGTITDPAFSITLYTLNERRLKYRSHPTNRGCSEIGIKRNSNSCAQPGFYTSIDIYILEKKKQACQEAAKAVKKQMNDSRLSFENTFKESFKKNMNLWHERLTNYKKHPREPERQERKMALHGQLIPDGKEEQQSLSVFAIKNTPDKKKSPDLFSKLEELIESIASNPDKKAKQEAAKTFITNKENSLTIFDINTCFISISGIKDLNSHRHPYFDWFFRKKNTTTWQQTILFLRLHALKVVAEQYKEIKKEAGELKSQKFLNDVRQLSIFTLHRNNSFFTVAFTRTQAIRDIDFIEQNDGKLPARCSMDHKQ